MGHMQTKEINLALFDMNIVGKRANFCAVLFYVLISKLQQF